MEKIEAWKTFDGQIFQSENEALEHEEVVTVRANVDSLFAACDVAKSHSDAVIDVMVENRAAFIRALGGLPKSKNICR